MHLKTKDKLIFNISEDNAKMGEIPSFSVQPIATCNQNVPCIKDCYACKMCNRRDIVLMSYIRNTENFRKADKRELIRKFSAFINGMEYTHFRWNVGGDFRLEGYFEFCCKVAEKCPNTKFLAFTKCYSFATVSRPANFNLILSAWNDYAPTALQEEKCPVAHYCDGSRPMPTLAQKCDGKCDTCYKCFTLKPGEAVYFEKH